MLRIEGVDAAVYCGETLSSLFVDPDHLLLYKASLLHVLQCTPPVAYIKQAGLQSQTQLCFFVKTVFFEG